MELGRSALKTVAVAILSLTLSNAGVSAPRPVVVIPGIMGSKLCDHTGKVLWGDRASYTTARISALRLPFDLNSRDRGIKSCGLIENVSIIPLLWESNVYVGLMDFLRTLGYSEHQIVTFHYDWRLSNFENANLLRD